MAPARTKRLATIFNVILIISPGRLRPHSCTYYREGNLRLGKLRGGSGAGTARHPPGAEAPFRGLVLEGPRLKPWVTWMQRQSRGKGRQWHRHRQRQRQGKGNGNPPFSMRLKRLGHPVDGLGGVL